MDDRRFDSLVKSLASGASRRSVLKGVLGLGGAALGGGVLLEGGVDAATRSTPTPKPVSCPGRQTWNGTQCKCPSGLNECGPDCCNPTGIPDTPNYSECCDNACCYGHCYGEELCCEYPLVFCAAQNECCGPSDNQCCGSMGCCDHECCQVAGGAGACCEGDTPKCCPDDSCIPEDGCCTDADCGDGCQTCQDHVCRDDNSQCNGCLACHDDTCVPDASFCADDGDVCTDVSCDSGGNCINTENCTNSADCCNDAPYCSAGICNQETGECDYSTYDCRNAPESNPLFCCTAIGAQCGDNGQCFVPCADTGEICGDEAHCCDSDDKCYSIEEDVLAVCGPCIDDNIPCGLACGFCCHTWTISPIPTPTPICVACIPFGLPCTDGDDCCGDNICPAGFCVGFDIGL